MVLFYHLTWCPVLLDHYNVSVWRHANPYAAAQQHYVNEISCNCHVAWLRQGGSAAICCLPLIGSLCACSVYCFSVLRSKQLAHSMMINRTAMTATHQHKNNIVMTTAR
jgi:hypothetical protein